MLHSSSFRETISIPIQSSDNPMLATISDNEIYISDYYESPIVESISGDLSNYLSDVIEVDLGERERNFDLTFGLWTDATYTSTLAANTEPGFHSDSCSMGPVSNRGDEF